MDDLVTWTRLCRLSVGVFLTECSKGKQNVSELVVLTVSDKAGYQQLLKDGPWFMKVTQEEELLHQPHPECEVRSLFTPLWPYIHIV